MNKLNFEDFTKYLEKNKIKISTVPFSKFKQDLERRENVENVYTENRNPYILFGYLNDRLLKHLQEGTSFLLPKNGIIRTPAAYNLTTGKVFTGLTQIMLQERMQELDTKVSAFLTYDDLQEYSTNNNQNEKIDFSSGTLPIKIPNVNDYNWDFVLNINKWYNINQFKAKEGFIHRYTTYYGVKPYCYYSTTFDEEIELTQKTITPYKYIARVLDAIYENKSIIINDELANNFRESSIKLLSRYLPNKKRDILAAQKMCSSAQKYYENEIKNNKKRDKVDFRNYGRYS